MKIYINKVSKTLLFVLIIIAILGLIYLAIPKYQTIPKYQIYTIKVDHNIADVYDRVLIIKLNTITGETDTWYEQYDPNPSKKLKFTF